MRSVTIVFLTMFFAGFLQAQNVGVNTASPLRRFSVNGSIMVDQGNTNTGTLDSAALLIGTNAGIFSNKNAAGTNYNGLDFWTNNQRRITIGSSGLVGIGLGPSAPVYPLDVNGTIRARSNLRSDFDVVAEDDVYVGDNLSVTGPTTLGGTLSVAGAASMDGNVTIGGTASVGGKGIVRSNSSTNLRMGFSSGAFAIILNPGQTTDILFNIVSFAGDNDNIRVAISQFAPDAGSGDSWGKIVMTVHSVDAAANQCKIRFHNPSSAASTMDGRLYLLSVATD